MEDLKEMFAQMMRFQMESQQKTKEDFFSCYKEIRKRNKKTS